MRTLFCAISLLLGVANVSATDYFEEGTVWEVAYDGQTSHIPEEFVYEFYLEGDTVIGGLSCLKMWRQSLSDNSGKELVTCIYKEGEKIYLFPHKGSEEKALLYDFSLQPNQSTSVAFLYDEWEQNESKYNYEVECNQLSTISIGKLKLEAMDITEYPEGIESKIGSQSRWIKGIGSTRGVLDNVGASLDGYGAELKRVTHKGNTVIEYGMVSGIKVEKVSGKAEMSAKKYRLDGTRLTGNGNAKGIYVVGGKKVHKRM